MNYKRVACVEKANVRKTTTILRHSFLD